MLVVINIRQKQGNESTNASTNIGIDQEVGLEMTLATTGAHSVDVCRDEVNTARVLVALTFKC